MDLSVVNDSALPAFERPVSTRNPDGRGGLVLVCEHASNHVPRRYRNLGLGAAELQRHIAWDLGALALAERLSDLLDAPLVHAGYSRLLLDLNRAVDAPDSIVTTSEGTPIPGNAALDPEERERRCALLYRPFHAELEALLDRRLADGWNGALVSVHTFTPVYHGVARPWHAGVISSQRERRLAEALLAQLRADAALCVGDNEPYGPAAGAHHTMERHAERRGLRCAALEVRNDQLRDEHGLEAWALRLHAALVGAAAS